MGQRRGAGGRVRLAAVALCAVVAWPGGHALAAPAEDPGDPGAYRTAEDARPVRGGSDSSVAEPLEPDGVYTDEIRPGQRLFYEVDLDAKSSAYLSVVAAPEPGSTVKFNDGIDITLESPDGTECDSSGARTFGSGEQARPIADYAARLVERGGDCQSPGPYSVVVERTSDAASAPDPWPIELRYAREPAVKGEPTAPPAEGGWSSATPAPPSGERRQVTGGTGFNDARPIGEGVWRDELAPGQTRFYKVPVDWGQQLYTSAALAPVRKKSESVYVSQGLVVELYNTARGHVADAFQSYSGDQAGTGLGPTVPVSYRNRFEDVDDDIAKVPFAGHYYLAVSLHPKVREVTDEDVALTLRVKVQGDPKGAPQYAGPAGEFQVTQDQREEASTGGASSAGRTMRLVGVAGIGTGTVLLLGLGAWTLAARRAAPAGASAPPAAGGVPPQYGGPYGPRDGTEQPDARPAEPGWGGSSTRPGDQEHHRQPGRQSGPPSGW